jgi:hypothetical protein
MKAKPVTPAEAKALWHSLQKPSDAKVAARFKAAGRPISKPTIGRWRRAHWARVSIEGIAEDAAAALATMDSAAPALTGDVKSTLDDILKARAAAVKRNRKRARPDTRSNVDRAEAGLRTAIAGATTVWEVIHEIAAAARGGTAASDAPSMLLLGAPDALAKLMMAASAAINMGTQGIGQISAFRAEQAAVVPGGQTVYLPGQGPYAESFGPDGAQGEPRYLSRSTIESIDQALEEFRKQNT